MCGWQFEQQVIDTLDSNDVGPCKSGQLLLNINSMAAGQSEGIYYKSNKKTQILLRIPGAGCEAERSRLIVVGCPPPSPPTTPARHRGGMTRGSVGVWCIVPSVRAARPGARAMVRMAAANTCIGVSTQGSAGLSECR